MTSFFQNHSVLFALLCAGLAIAWGLGLTLWLLRKPAGTERMQEIARAIQQGAAAYMRRQYLTVSVVAVACRAWARYPGPTSRASVRP